MKSAIVTGANGFIGSNVVKKLADNAVFVTAVSRKNNNIMKSDNVRFISLDMDDINKLPELDVKGDIFYHFAWRGVSGNESADLDIQLQNIRWNVNALKVSKKIGCNRFVGTGSIMEREVLVSALGQGNCPDMREIYKAAKFAAHSVTKSIAADIGIEHIWGSITNAYGPGELSPRFINSTILKILNNEPLKFTAATQNYDFIYIDDAAEAFFRIGEAGRPFHEYLIGSSKAKALQEFITEMIDILSPGQKLFFGSAPFSGINLNLEDFDCTVTEKDTGFRAKTSFADGIKKTAAWLKNLNITDKL
jgi:nucleoside-diphosphate-sugar epimerase